MKAKKIGIMIVISCIILVAAISIVLTAKTANESNRLKEQIDLGQRYLDELKYEEAVLSFQMAIEIDSGNEEAYIGIIEAYVELEDYESALAYAERGYEVTGAQQLLEQKKIISVKIQISENLKQGEKSLLELDYKNAILSFKKVLELQPNNVMAYLGIAEAYIRQEDYEEALKYVQEGYSVTGDKQLADKKTDLEQKILNLKIESLVLAGNSYLEQEDYENAIEVFLTALELDTDNAEIYIKIIETYMQQGNYENALEYAQKGYTMTNDFRLSELISKAEELIAEREEQKVQKVQEAQATGISEREDYQDGSYVIMDYDSRGRLIKETDYYPDGTTWFMEITYNGNTQYINYNNYSSDLLEFDNSERIIAQTLTFNDGRAVRNERIYDGAGNCTVKFFNSSGEMIRETVETEETGSQKIYFDVTNWE